MDAAQHDTTNPDGHANRTVTALALSVKGVASRSAELESALREYVTYLRTQGLSAERVVIAVKNALAQTGNRNGTYISDAFVDGVVSFCIAEFYKDAPQRG